MKLNLKFEILIWSLALSPAIAALMIQPSDKSFYLMGGFYVAGLIGVFMEMINYRKGSHPLDSSIEQGLFLKMRISNAIYEAALGFILLYSSLEGAGISGRIFMVLAALHFSFKGNYQALIQQNSNYAGILKDYSSNSYKKAQRILGRYQFVLGLSAATVFLFVPSQYLLHAGMIAGGVLFIGAFWYLIRVSSFADQS